MSAAGHDAETFPSADPAALAAVMRSKGPLMDARRMTPPLPDRQRLAAILADQCDPHRLAGRSWSDWLRAADAALAVLAEM